MKKHPISSRRRFLKTGAGGFALGMLPSCSSITPWFFRGPPFFQTRGVVLVPDDLPLADWPARAWAAGLTTIALYDSRSPRVVARFIRSERGQSFLASCRELGLDVEYELHAMGELLPRDLFEKDPTLFRMDDRGERIGDANLCVHSEGTLDLVAKHAQGLARQLRPTTHRYFLWGDDGKPWCRCRRCATLTDSDQALLLANWLLEALRADDPEAQVAHLAYVNTLEAPTQVTPKGGVFLEFAPSQRRHDIPLRRGEDETQRRHLEALDANLAVFGSGGAQALEYWLDCTTVSRNQQPDRRVVLHEALMRSDLETYGSRGIRHVTTFARSVDAASVVPCGAPPLDAYGTELRSWRPQ